MLASRLLSLGIGVRAQLSSDGFNRALLGRGLRLCWVSSVRADRRPGVAEPYGSAQGTSWPSAWRLLRHGNTNRTGKAAIIIIIIFITITVIITITITITIVLLLLLLLYYCYYYY